METRRVYEEQIAKELRDLPQSALAEILRLVGLVSDKYRKREGLHARRGADHPNHERSRELLATSNGNWAHDLIRDREDRL